MITSVSKLKFVGLLFSLVIFANFAGAETGKSYQEQFRAPKILLIAGNGSRFAWDDMEAELDSQITFISDYSEWREATEKFTDMPIEASPEMVQSVVNHHKRYMEEILGRLKDFDVIVILGSIGNKEFWKLTEERVANWVQAGGKLVYASGKSRMPGESSPLLPLMPVQTVKGKKSWQSAQGASTAHQMSCGLPTEFLGDWEYGDDYEPRKGSDIETAALNMTFVSGGGPAGAQTPCVYGKFVSGGQVVFLSSPPFSMYWGSWGNSGYKDCAPNRPDDALVWTHLLRRIVYTLTHGAEAYPVLAKFEFESGATVKEGVLTVPLRISHNFGPLRKICIETRISEPRIGTLWKQSQDFEVKTGASERIDISAILESPLPSTQVKIETDIIDATSGAKISEAFTWLPVRPSAPFKLSLNGDAVLNGQEIKAHLEIGKDSPAGDYTAKVMLVDFRGRALQEKAIPNMSHKPDTAASADVSFIMPKDQSGSEYAYWVTAFLYRDGKLCGHSRQQIYNDSPWDMRRQFQVSVWAEDTRMQNLRGRDMTLLTHAGMNSLGFGGNIYWAERLGMRMYNESTGVNTFGVKIERDNWGDVGKDMEKTLDPTKGKRSSRSLALVSLGEESGFDTGWGKRYYWKEDKAPAVAQRVFAEYLTERYKNDLVKLNEAWGSDYKSFDEIPLTRVNSQGPAQNIVSAQNYAKDSKEKPWIINADVANVDPTKPYIAKIAPSLDSFNFFDWYYEKYCTFAMETFRKKQNAAALSIMSAPGGFYPKVDVYNYNGIGPFRPKEEGAFINEMNRSVYDDTPGFSGAMWTHFDSKKLWYSQMWSSISAGNTHIDCWHYPFNFNSDMSLPRSSFWMKVLRERLRPIEPLLLHKRIAKTDGLGMFTGKQPLKRGLLGDLAGNSGDLNAPIFSALEESGFWPKVVSDAKDIKGMKVLFASYSQVVSDEQAEALRSFVENGGLLISTAWLGSLSPEGNPLTAYPAKDSTLAKLLGFRLLQASQNKLAKAATISVLPSGDIPVAEPLSLGSYAYDKVLDMGKDVRTLASYPDGTPAILARNCGKGKLIHFNMVYDWSGWWGSFYEPSREGLRRVFAAILKTDGQTSIPYFIAYRSYDPQKQPGWWGTVLSNVKSWKAGDSVPFWFATPYTDPSGLNRYLFIYSDHRSPAIKADLQLPASDLSVYDALTHEKLIAGSAGTYELSIEAGGGMLLAFMQTPPSDLKLKGSSKVQAGSEFEIAVDIAGKNPVKAAHGIVLEASGPDGKTFEPFCSRNLTIENGSGKIKFTSALNDPRGTYRIRATECVTGVSNEITFEITGVPLSESNAMLHPFIQRESEQVSPLKMDGKEFLRLLGALREVYLNSYKNLEGLNRLEAKWKLDYFMFAAFVGKNESRHHIMHTLVKVDWLAYVDAVASAMAKGECFYLTGEDIGLDPKTGLQIETNSSDKKIFLEKLAACPGAKTKSMEVEDSFIVYEGSARSGKESYRSDIPGRKLTVIEIGKGRLVYDPVSLQELYLSSAYIAWQEAWLEMLRGKGL